MAEGKIGPGDLPTALPSPRLVGGDGKLLRTIDVHAHASFPEIMKLAVGAPDDTAFRVRTQGQVTLDYNRDVMFPACGPSFASLNVRLAQMDAMGVDVQVVSPSPGHYYYWADADLAEDLTERINAEIAALCAREPARLVGLGWAALQHPVLAAEQLRRAVKHFGLKGVEITSQIAGADLSDRKFDPFWAAAEELDALVFIHPMGCSLDERLAPAYLSNHLGQPVEHAVALSHLIFGGVLDRHPGLKLVAAHGGGFLPVHVGRADHAWAQRSDAHTCAHRPSSYLSRLHFDSLVFDPLDLEHLIRRVGPSQVVVGTDYPFDMGHYDIHGLIAAVPGLSDAERAAILGGNLERLLGL